jgi:inositol oxygenase
MSDHTFRSYDYDTKIAQTYKLNHENQTLEFVETMLNKHCTKFDKCKKSIWDIINLQDQILDESDPDINQKQIVHAFQTAEYIKKKYPDREELHLVALLHDCGKVLLLKEFGGLPQWAVVGDTFPVGCKFSNQIIYPDFFQNNPDEFSELGIYLPRCGLDNVLFSFSHDIYAYKVFKHNQTLLPESALKIIRYHSFYSWHMHGAYEHLMNQSDYEIRELCHQFSQCDLYSKDNHGEIDIEQLKPYYDGLIKKYFPNEILEW